MKDLEVIYQVIELVIFELEKFLKFRLMLNDWAEEVWFLLSLFLLKSKVVKNFNFSVLTIKHTEYFVIGCTLLKLAKL